MNTKDQVIKDFKLDLKKQGTLLFGPIYDQYAPSLFGWIISKEPNRTKAEHLLYQTFLSMWMQKDCYDEKKSSFLVWLIQLSNKEIKSGVNSSLLSTN